MNSRLRITIRGAVQGVGFRPFIYRLANELRLSGYVNNSSVGVIIEAEGRKDILDEFVLRIPKEKPPLAKITGIEFSYLDCIGYVCFEIKSSSQAEQKTTIILPDIALCDDCLREMLNPSDRRYLYPFINCTNCGPRFSIIESLPYDRQNTSMKKFVMCEKCFNEYSNPSDRRFHAQPIACPDCGPHVELWNSSGEKLFGREDAVFKTIEFIKDGKIIALKGLGGYQLIVNAGDDEAVRRLRFKKHREEKPFAVMVPSQHLNDYCDVSMLEERLLRSPESPIVLLKKKTGIDKKLICDLIAPDNPYLGLMLPYTPLHHLIMIGLDTPIVATSGNIAEEPMCITEEEALNKLGMIADYFLVYNRSIVRHVDDSIVRIVNGKEMVLRRARGYAPFPVQVKSCPDSKIKLAVGAHLKNTVAIGIDENVFISQHIGDLSTSSAFDTFKNSMNDLASIYEKSPEIIIHDSHPDYLSTKYANELNIQKMSVQHHLSHVAACKAENQVEGKAIGIAWDGTGYGLDGSIWGSEFFILNDSTYSHIGQLRKFSLPGGEQAIKEGKRSLVGLLYELYENKFLTDKKNFLTNKFTDNEIAVMMRMLEANINSLRTSSAGRLFDAVSSLIGISDISDYEGQSAMKLEFTADECNHSEYDFEIYEDKIFICDWQPMIEGIIGDIEQCENKGNISAKFHNTLARMIQKMCLISDEENVLLSGGCFQNIFLVKRTLEFLITSGFKVYTHQRVPPNDGGISLGQIAACNLKHIPFDMEVFKKKHLYQEV
ncbi:MAG: carbamoyltransferase HypF [bacterium]